MKASALLVPVVGLLLTSWAVIASFGMDRAEAQSAAAPVRAMDADQWMSANGFTVGANGFTMDGGVNTPVVRTSYEEVGVLDAGTVKTDTLDVSGPASFRTPPTGTGISAALVKSTTTLLAVGCTTLGTVPVTPTAVDDQCVLTSVPTAALSLGATYDCYVKTAGVATVRACGLLAVTLPAGTYRISVTRQ